MAEKMRKVIIGLSSHGSGLDHVADRRLVIPWATNRGHRLVAADDPRADIVFLNPRSPVSRSLKTLGGRPAVFVLRDDVCWYL